MPTLGERVQRRDRERFVGRRSELSRFDDLLAGDPVRIVYVTGVGGIGKSTLLREVARRASSDGYGVVWLDGRDLPPFPTVLDSALSPIDEFERAIVIIDSYEMISSLDGHLRDVVIPRLADTTIVVFASRLRPSVGWFDAGWDSVFEVMSLDGLPASDLRSMGVARRPRRRIHRSASAVRSRFTTRIRGRCTNGTGRFGG